MSHTIKIEIVASLQDSWLVHRLLNFKEDIYREFSRHEQVTIVDKSAVDSALVPLAITVHSKPILGTVESHIKKSIQKHEVGDAAHVSRVV